MELHFEYYVVEFLHQPYFNIETYVCVPYSWIKANAYGTEDRRVAVAYPAEPWRHTERCVREKLSPRRGWTRYSALLRFGTDEFKEAKKYIRKKNSTDNKNSKVRKKKGRVLRRFNENVTTKNDILNCLNKELRVRVTRTSLLEYRVKGKETENVKNTPNIERPTVIRTAKPLNETSDCNKILEKKSEFQLISTDNKLKENVESDCTISNSQIMFSSGLQRQLAYSINKFNQESPQQVPNNSSNYKSQETPIEKANEITGVQNILSSESNLKNPSTISTPKAISECDESIKLICKKKTDIQNSVLLAHCPALYNCQNTSCQTNCSYENHGKQDSSVYLNDTLKKNPANETLSMDIEAKLDKDLNKEQFGLQQSCSQNATDKLPHDAQKSNHLLQVSHHTEFPKPSDYFKLFPFNYRKDTFSQDRPNIATEGANIENSVAQEVNPQNKIETMSNHEKTYSHKVTKDHLTKGDHFCDLRTVINNDPSVDCHLPMRLNLTTHMSQILHQSNEQTSPLKANTTVIHNSNNYVVQDPRKVIIKNVIKVKPKKRRHLPSITTNKTPTTDQIRSALPIVEDQTTEISKKYINNQYPPNYNNKLIQNISIQDIISAKVNKQLCNKKSTSDISKCNSKKLSKVPDPDLMEDYLSIMSYNTIVSRYYPPSTNSSFSQSTPVDSNTLKTLLLQKINYKRQGKLDEDVTKNYLCNSNTNNLLKNGTSKTENHLIYFEDKQTKKDEQLHNNNSNHSNTIHELCTTEKITSEQANSIKSLEFDQNIQSKNKDYSHPLGFYCPLLDIGLPERTPQHSVLCGPHPATPCDPDDIVAPPSSEPPYSHDDVICISDSKDDHGETMNHDKVKLTLPPEYEPNNSKWTLKYQNATPEIVELIPGSRVYVNEMTLNHYITDAKSYNVLAQRLIVELFSLNALSVCSITGATNYKQESRPALDKSAMLTILQYIEEYGRANGWGPMNAKAVLISLRSKIFEVRSILGAR